MTRTGGGRDESFGSRVRDSTVSNKARKRPRIGDVIDFRIPGVTELFSGRVIATDADRVFTVVDSPRFLSPIEIRVEWRVL